MLGETQGPVGGRLVRFGLGDVVLPESLRGSVQVPVNGVGGLAQLEVALVGDRPFRPGVAEGSALLSRDPGVVAALLDPSGGAPGVLWGLDRLRGRLRRGRVPAPRPGVVVGVGGEPVTEGGLAAEVGGGGLVGRYVARYQGLLAEAVYLRLSDDAVVALVGELVGLVGDGFVDDRSEEVLGSAVVGSWLMRVDRALAGVAVADREVVVGFVNDALLSASLGLVREGGVRQLGSGFLTEYPDRRVMLGLSPAGLGRVLAAVAEHLESGVVGEGVLGEGVVGRVGYDGSGLLAARLARVVLADVDAGLVALLVGGRLGGLFSALVGSALVGEALFASGGVVEESFVQVGAVAAINGVVSGRVPTIVGLLAAGQVLLERLDELVGDGGVGRGGPGGVLLGRDRRGWPRRSRKVRGLVVSRLRRSRAEFGRMEARVRALVGRYQR